jgi:hypothetical protein
MRRPGACGYGPSPPARRTGPRPFIKSWSLDRRPTALIERNEGVPDESNQGCHPEDGRCGLIPPKGAAARGGGASPRRCHGALLQCGGPAAMVSETRGGGGGVCSYGATRGGNLT